MNYIMISPNFPKIYWKFAKALKDKQVNVLGIGDEPYDCLDNSLKENLTEYCYVSDMNNIEWMKNTIYYLKNKYGEIDYIESNNEYWLENDAKLREFFDIKNGVRPNELNLWKRKSTMKEFFLNAGVKVARYTLNTSLDECLSFSKEVGYPLFAKPDNGVGASNTYKIENDDDLIAFYNETKNYSYIIEEYINGDLISFDGIANDNSNVVICFNEHFPIPVADIVTKNLDLYYYARTKMSSSLKAIGKRIVKSFKLKKRCFHIELFVLRNDKDGLGKKGDIIALEANMRVPGGNTPDLLSLAMQGSFYDAYAEVILNNINSYKTDNTYISVSVNRKFDRNYKHTKEDIFNKYSSSIKDYGFYPQAFRNAMGDEYYFAIFKTETEMLDFVHFVNSI